MSGKSQKKIITVDTVRHAATLARLSLDDGEVRRMQSQLARILGYIEQLDEVDTEDTPPTFHVLSSMKNVFREDELKKSLPVDEVLSNAPDRKGDFFKVPKVIKEA